MKARLGVTLSRQGLRWVLAAFPRRGPTRIPRCGFVERRPGEEDDNLIARFRAELRAGQIEVLLIDDVQPPVLRVVQLPPMPERDAMLALHHEAQTEVEILGGVVAHAAVPLESGTRQNRYLLAITPGERLSALHRSMERSDLRLAGVAVAPVLLMDLLRDMSMLEPQQSIAMVELGSAKANLAVARGGTLSLLRQMQQGLDSSFLTGTDGFTVTDVERTAPASATPDATGGMAPPVLKLVTNEADPLELLDRMDRGLGEMAELVGQIRGWLELGRERGECGPISRLVLAGEAVRARPLAGLIGNDLRIPVEVLDPRTWHRLQASSALDDDAPSFVLPLALAALPARNHSLVLSEPSWRRAETARLPLAVGAGCLVLDALLAAGLVQTARETDTMREAIARHLQERAPGAASMATGIPTSLAPIDWARGRMDALALGLAPTVILDAISGCQPSSVRLTSFRMEGERFRWQVALEAAATGPDATRRQAAMNAFVDRLRAHPAFHGFVMAPLEEETGPRTQRDALRFSLVIGSDGSVVATEDDDTAGFGEEADR